MDKYAVIVAGGSGSRMQASIPKQFMLLDNQPVLMHTLKKFAGTDPRIKLILVLPAAEIATWERLVEENSFSLPHQLVAGGATRVDSVRNGLNEVPENSLVAIHDGVRPLVSQELIRQCYDAALEYGSGVAAVNSKDSIRKISGNSNLNVMRADYRLMQTPQTFQAKLIKAAFENYAGDTATDDATIAERDGLAIHLVEGEYTNLKITTPEDLIIAQALQQNNLVR